MTQTHVECAVVTSLLLYNRAAYSVETGIVEVHSTWISSLYGSYCTRMCAVDIGMCVVPDLLNLGAQLILHGERHSFRSKCRQY